jgi:hypothetical protein
LGSTLRRDFPQPQWRGEAASGQCLLVHTEQGFGDTLHFCRYIPLAAARGLRVVVQAPKPLARLMTSLEGVDQVILEGAPLPPFDFHCPMLSLPLALGSTMDSLPRHVPYLRAEPSQAEAWRHRLDELGDDRPRVGLVWQGGIDKEPRSARAIGRQRSFAPEMLAPLFDVSRVRFFSLQKEGSRAPEEFPLTDFMSEMVDFADTAALVENLDLVITIDTSVVHLAGALGRPVWLLDRFLPCWRWLHEERTSPWYPTLRRYQQDSPTDWRSAVTAVTRDLRAFSDGWGGRQTADPAV